MMKQYRVSGSVMGIILPVMTRSSLKQLTRIRIWLAEYTCITDKRKTRLNNNNKRNCSFAFLTCGRSVNFLERHDEGQLIVSCA